MLKYRFQGSNIFGSEQPSVGGPSEPHSAVFGSELASNYLGTIILTKIEKKTYDIILKYSKNKY